MVISKARERLNELSQRPSVIEDLRSNSIDEALDHVFESTNYVEYDFWDSEYESGLDEIGVMFKRLETRFEKKCNELLDSALDCWQESHQCDLKSNYSYAFDRAFREICRSDKFDQVIKDSENGALDFLLLEKLDTLTHATDDVFKFGSLLEKQFQTEWKSEVVKNCKLNGLQKELENLLDKVFEKDFNDMFGFKYSKQ